jgi:hypothetical protein
VLLWPDLSKLKVVKDSSSSDPIRRGGAAQNNRAEIKNKSKKCRHPISEILNPHCGAEGPRKKSSASGLPDHGTEGRGGRPGKVRRPTRKPRGEPCNCRTPGSGAWPSHRRSIRFPESHGFFSSASPFQRRSPEPPSLAPRDRSPSNNRHLYSGRR